MSMMLKEKSWLPCAIFKEKIEITLIPEQKTNADDQGDKEDESKVD